MGDQIKQLRNVGLTVESELKAKKLSKLEKLKMFNLCNNYQVCKGYKTGQNFQMDDLSQVGQKT